MAPIAERIERGVRSRTKSAQLPWDVGVEDFAGGSGGSINPALPRRIRQRKSGSGSPPQPAAADRESRAPIAAVVRKKRAEAVPAPTAAKTAPRRRGAGMWRVAEQLRMLALEPVNDEPVHLADELRRAANTYSTALPRHAALALAAHDALICSPRPLETDERRGTLFNVALALASRFVSTEQEMELLAAMTAAGLDRTPPFEQSIVFRMLEGRDDDKVR